EGMTLFLPAEQESGCFRLALIEKEKQNKTLMTLPIGFQSESNIDEETVKQMAKRRFNIERLLGSFGNIFNKQKTITELEAVTVRIGDALRSIALKHPLLGDVPLWKLLAQLNEVALAVDSKGVPTGFLVRGMTLQLPTAEEIAEYRAKQA